MRWERLNPWRTMEVGGPGKRWGHTCNAIRGGKLLYVFGGYGKDNCQTNQVHVFDTDTRAWREPIITGTPPTPRDSHTCTTVGDCLFVFGGTDGMKPLRDLHVLDTLSNTWFAPSVRGDGPEAREGHSAALIGKRLFIFGGCGKSMNHANEVYYNDLYILDTETFVWQRASTLGTPPTARDSHSCSSWNSRIIVVGGEDQHDYYLSDVHVLDTDTLIWKELNTSGQLLPPRAGHTTVAFGKHLFVFGGFTDAQNLYDDLYRLDVDTGIWTKVMPSGEGPSARFSMAGDCLNPSKAGILMFIGGCNKHLEALDDMYYLHTELMSLNGRDERRLEKLSLRKQLKMKCQERQSLAGAADMNTPVSVPIPSQPGQQYFHLNMYRPQIGKRTFQAKVTKDFAGGYTIETVIDGRPLRGILFSNKHVSSPKTNLNPNGVAEKAGGEGKVMNDNDPKTRSSSHEPHVEAASESAAKNPMPSEMGLSHEASIGNTKHSVEHNAGLENERMSGALNPSDQAWLQNPCIMPESSVSLSMARDTVVVKTERT